MSTEKNINEIIAELEHIGELYLHHLSLEDSKRTVNTEISDERSALTKTTVAELRLIQNNQDKQFGETPSIVTNWIDTPPTLEKLESTNPIKEILIGSISGLAIWVGAALFLVFSLFSSSMGTSVGSLVLMPAIVTWLLYGKKKTTLYLDWQKSFNKWTDDMKTWENTFNQSVGVTEEENNRFLNEFIAYERRFAEHVNNCDKLGSERINRFLLDDDAIVKRYTDQIAQIDGEDKKTIAQLDEINLIHKDLFPHVFAIASALKRGRADSLKDAINLALEEHRKDEEEKARQEEAARREAILEEQAMQERLHNERMEKAAIEHNKAMEKAAKEQSYAMEKAAKEQANMAQKASTSRCGYCVNYSKCSIKAKLNSDNCPAFRPQ